MDNMDNFEDKTIIAPTTPHNQGYEEPKPEPERNYNTEDSLSKVEYLKGLKVLFKDPNMKNNLLIGSIFALIPIAGALALQGWFCEIIQRSLRKHPVLIPKLSFSDLGHYLVRGLMPFLVSLVGGSVLGVFIGIFVVIGFVITGLIAQANDFLGLIFLMGVYFLIFLAQFVIMMILAVPTTFAEVSEDFKQVINFKQIIACLKMAWSKYLIGFILVALVSIPLMLGGTLLCGIGVYPAIFIISFLMFYLRLQIYHYYLAQGGGPVEVKAEQKLPSEQALAANPS